MLANAFDNILPGYLAISLPNGLSTPSLDCHGPGSTFLLGHEESLVGLSGELSLAC